MPAYTLEHHTRRGGRSCATLRAADGRLFVPARSGTEEFDPPAFAGHKGFIRPEFLARRLW
jgi:hypothetical protein